MLFALGAVSSALDAIQSLTNSKSSSSTHKTGSAQGASNPFAINSSSSSTTSGATSSVNSGNCAQISPETMSALIAAQSQSSDSTSSAATSTSARLDVFDVEWPGCRTQGPILADRCGRRRQHHQIRVRGRAGRRRDQPREGRRRVLQDGCERGWQREPGRDVEGAEERPPRSPSRPRHGRLGRWIGFLVEVRWRIDLDHDDGRRRLDHHHRHLRRRLQDVDDRTGRERSP